jgi:hypothetical protein
MTSKTVINRTLVSRVATAERFPALAVEQVRATGAGSMAIERNRQDWARRLLLQTPPLYLTTMALLGGDAIGNWHLFVPIWIVIAAAALALSLFLFNRPVLGMVVAIPGLICAATLPLHDLLEPDFSSQTVREFSDGAAVTLEGWVVRALEPQPGGHTYLYLDVQSGKSAASTMSPATGLVRVTALDAEQYRIGDRLKASGRLRFPLTTAMMTSSIIEDGCSGRGSPRLSLRCLRRLIHDRPSF